LTSDGLYSFTGGGIELLVDPATASVARLSLDGKNALLPRGESAGKYSAELEGSTLVLKSGPRAKRFRLDTARRSVELTYTDTSEPAAAQGFHDVMRVPSGTGLTFFPGTPRLLPDSTLRLNVWQPVIWFAHDQAREPKTVEASVEGSEGWLATVSDGLALIKVCDGPKPIIKLTSSYDATTKQRPWVELEQRSAGGGALAVRLFLRKLPPNLVVKPGNQELVGFVRGVIQ
jgi:hypothetical protein